MAEYVLLQSKTFWKHVTDVEFWLGADLSHIEYFIVIFLYK